MDDAPRFAVRCSRLGFAAHLDEGGDFRTTANSIYAVAKGRGATIGEGRRLDWRRGDVVVAPTWYGHWHEAEEDSILFRVTDEEAMRRLGFLREESL